MFVDTSGFYCFINAADSQHAEATALMQGESDRFTHSYVLAELVALCQARRIDRGLALNFTSAVLEDGNIGIIWVDEQLHRESLALLQARPDKQYSLCDAVSFVLMSRSRETVALSTDRHFEQEGFHRLLRG